MDIQPTEKKSNLVKNILLIVGVIVALAVVTLEVRAVTLPENRTLRRVNLGNRYLSELKYEEAIAEYDLAIAIDPKNVDAYLGKAEAYVQMDDIDSAIETLAEGYDETDDDEIREEWLDLQMDLARKCLNEEDYEQAITEFDNVLDIDDGYVEAYLWKAEAQENLGDTDAAMETLQEGYDRTGDARLQRAMEELGAQEEAEDQAQDAVDEDEVIVWHDAELERWTRETLGIPEGDIRRRDVQQITEMKIQGPYPVDGITGYDVKSIEDLAYFTSLTSLAIYDCGINDISALGSLTNLQELDLAGTGVSDISALGSLTNLEKLDLYWENISDISALSNLTNLKVLEVIPNSTMSSHMCSYGGLGSVSDISALSGLTNLQELYLGFNENISDISVLSRLTNLERLDLAYNQISDLSPLSGLTNLTYLCLEGNQISDVSALSGLTNLQELYLGNNNISDTSALSGLTNVDLEHIFNCRY